MHVETTYNTAHIFHMANMLLVIQAIWITADAAAHQAAHSQTERSGRLPLVPRWVSLASIAYIGIFHTAAGLSKLSYSGPGWASGTSLQLWTYLWGYPWSPTTQLILSSRTFTQICKSRRSCSKRPASWRIFPRLRPWIGLGLLASTSACWPRSTTAFNSTPSSRRCISCRVEALDLGRRARQSSRKPPKCDSKRSSANGNSAQTLSPLNGGYRP